MRIRIKCWQTVDRGIQCQPGRKPPPERIQAVVPNGMDRVISALARWIALVFLDIEAEELAEIADSATEGVDGGGIEREARRAKMGFHGSMSLEGQEAQDTTVGQSQPIEAIKRHGWQGRKLHGHPGLIQGAVIVEL